MHDIPLFDESYEEWLEWESVCKLTSHAFSWLGKTHSIYNSFNRMLRLFWTLTGILRNRFCPSELQGYYIIKFKNMVKEEGTISDFGHYLRRLALKVYFYSYSLIETHVIDRFVLGLWDANWWNMFTLVVLHV